MKMTLAFLCAASVCVAAETAPAAAAPAPAAPANPIVTNPEFSDNVTFYVSFETKNADVANGSEKFDSKSGKLEPKWGPGLLGQGLEDGRARYKGKDNIDFTVPGSLIVWVCQKNYPTEKPANGKDPGWNPLWVSSGKRSVNICKPGHFNWNNGSALLYVTRPGQKQLEVYLWGKGSKWNNGDWHMLAMVWTPTSIGFSIDASPLKTNNLTETINGPAGLICVGGRENEKALIMSCDELMVFSKALSNEELLKIYTEIRKAANIPDGAFAPAAK